MDRLDEQAAESLAFIRTTMARSASFTAVPGAGGVVMGVIACVAAIVAARQPDPVVWLLTWLLAAAVAAPIGVAAMARKARRHGLPLWSASGRRFAQALVPALVAGAVLTVALTRAGHIDLLPPVWLLLYGVGILGGGAASLPVLAWLGAAFMVFGAAAAWTPAWLGDTWMAAGFGGLQIVFGIVIARTHGG
jgi:multisubunit Na+/H+ antiporter MnhG subunit